MAKVKITGHASGTGVITVTAPNTSTDRTITLPDTTGTLLDENSSVPAANLTGTVADARFPATLPAASAANLTTIPAANITGTLPAISGANLTGIPSTGLTSQQTFTSSGTWTKPTGITKIKVYVCGGGGGGGASVSTSWADWTAGGAGGGGTAVKIIDVTSISSVTVTIGAGGIANNVDTSSTAGGTSSFGSHCSGYGGGAGAYQNQPGAGGGATGGDYIIYGDDGTKNHTYQSVWFNGGKGGASYFGRGASGSAAGVQGGGGRGASAPNSGGGSNGTDGGAGFCLVEEYK